MGFTEFFNTVDWLMVVVMTLLSFVIGMVWHQPFLFGKYWTAINYGQKSPKEANVALMFGGTALLHFIAMIGLSAIVSHSGLENGLLVGLFYTLFIVFPSFGGTYFFANRPFRLFLIDAGMYSFLFIFASLLFSL